MTLCGHNFFLVALIKGLENLIDEGDYSFGVRFFSYFSAELTPVFSLARIHFLFSEIGVVILC